MRRWNCLALLLLCAAPAAAQDMPLSQILIDNEGWRIVEPGKAPAFPSPNQVTARQGMRYLLNRTEKQITLQRDDGTVMSRLEGLTQPSCLTLWPDGGFCVVGDAAGKYLWAFRVERNGALGVGDRYYALRVPAGESASGVTALTMDAAGRLYACTPLGVQVFDPTGRLCGVLHKPAGGALTAITFGGPERDVLYVKCGERVFARPTKASGVSPPTK